MVVELDAIKSLIKADTPDWVVQARKESDRLNVHVNGSAVAEYLNRFSHYENSTQFQLRKDIATSNKYAVADLLRPVDKVFSAKGGGKIYNVKDENKKAILRDHLNNIADGMDITKWIQNIQSNKYYSDPAGLVFMEWDEENTYPTIKSIHSIKSYESSGRDLEWVLFEGVKKYDENGKELEGEYFRFVDDSYDYLFKVTDESITQIEDDSFINIFEKVPAVINSDISSWSLKYNESPIEDQVELLDHYLRTTSVKNIYEFLHGYPIFWAYVQPCKHCDGTGLYEGQVCPVCDGAKHTLRKDVSDVIALKAPKEGQPKLAPDVAGYVQPDIETWREQRAELEWLAGLMQFSLWGSAVNEKADNETATGKWIDTQPVNDRLNKFSDAFEDMEQKITDLVGKFYLQASYEGSSVNYGRRFLVEPPEVIWNKYIKAKAAGAPKIALDYLLMQFFQSEYASDIESLAKAQKSVKLEPFIHKTDEEIEKLSNINPKDKIRKFYFDEWYKDVEEADLITKDIKALKALFEAYIADIMNQMPQVAETTQEDENAQESSSESSEDAENEDN